MTTSFRARWVIVARLEGRRQTEYVPSPAVNEDARKYVPKVRCPRYAHCAHTNVSLQGALPAGEGVDSSSPTPSSYTRRYRNSPIASATSSKRCKATILTTPSSLRSCFSSRLHKNSMPPGMLQEVLPGRRHLRRKRNRRRKRAYTPPYPTCPSLRPLRPVFRHAKT